MRQITKDVNTLRENDIISILLFGLYKLVDDPDYAAISELAYALDKNNLFKLCAIYGGATIKIPTIQEINNLSKVLLIIDLMYRGMPFEDAFSEADIDADDKDNVLKSYDILSTIIEDYINAKQN